MLQTVHTPADPADRPAEPDQEPVRLPDGTEIVIRAVEPGDKVLIAEGFKGLDPESGRSRHVGRGLDRAPRRSRPADSPAVAW